MAHLYHANAKTTVKIREEIKQSKETIKVLAKRYNLNPKTILKWKHAESVVDKKSGPTHPRSTVLSVLEEQIICEFRRVTKLPLDDVYLSLKDKIKKLTRSNLYRCLKRHGLNRLPQPTTQPTPEKKTFADYKLGYVHVDVTQVRLLGQGKYYIFVGIERVSKYVYVEIHDNMRIKTACAFLKNLISDCPFKIHRLLTDNGMSFKYRLLTGKRAPQRRKHNFDKVCEEYGIKHKLTKFRHPWTNGQVEVFNRVLKEHTTKKYFYEKVKELKEHVMSFVLLYNYQRKLKSLKYMTPYEKIIEVYEKDKTYFNHNPHHKILGLNRLYSSRTRYQLSNSLPHLPNFHLCR